MMIRTITSRDHTSKDMQRLIGWLFFNLLIGNNDSQAKNLAILYTADGPRLASFYDLMSTTLYSDLSSRFAMSISGEDCPGHIERSNLEALARALRFQPRYFLKQGLELAEQMPVAIDTIMAELSRAASLWTEQTLQERLRQRLSVNCRKMSLRWATQILSQELAFMNRTMPTYSEAQRDAHIA